MRRHLRLILLLGVWAMLVVGLGLLTVAGIAWGDDTGGTPTIINDDDVEVPDGFRIFEGDILMPEGFFSTAPGAVATYNTNLWPNGLVPYVIDSSIPSYAHSTILTAMRDWERVAGVDFFPRTTEVNYIEFFATTGNWSSVGMVGGRQQIGLWDYNHWGVVVHEIGHALGLWHEQSRADRDQYVQILWENIEDQWEFNFQILPFAGTVGPYDFDSIMHYSYSAFTNNGGMTIRVLPPNESWQYRIGQLDNLSTYDAQGMATLYPPRTDVSVTMSAAPDPVAPGAELVYTYTIRNHGPGDVYDMRLSSLVPSTLTYVGHSPGLNCVYQGVRMTIDWMEFACNLPLDSRATTTVTLRLRVGAETVSPIRSTTSVRVFGGPDETNVDNNFTQLETRVQGLTPPCAAGAPVCRVSTSSANTQANDWSRRASLSADGRYIAFQSNASNLVPGDSNNLSDVFVKDRQTGAITRVSVGMGGVQANNWSDEPSISVDGRYIAFRSLASNLVSDDSNGVADAFVYDRVTRQVERVSVGNGNAQSNGWTIALDISADGRFVAFVSEASNLASSDPNTARDVYLRDRQTGQTQHLSTAGGAANGASNDPAISDDGRYIAFRSAASNLVGGDSNGVDDIFVRDRQGGIARVSVSSSGGQGNAAALGRPELSADGRFVVFVSEASNLFDGDSNSRADVFVYDRNSGSTERVSTSTGGALANHSSDGASISPDGRYAAFRSAASNLVSGDSNSAADIFVRDRQTGQTIRLPSNGTQPNGGATSVSLGDGGRAAVVSAASNLVGGDSNSREDVFVMTLEFPPPPTQADLYVVHAVETRPGRPGDAGAYNLTVGNRGPALARDVEVRARFDAATTFNSITPPSGGTCQQDSGGLLCRFAQLPAGERRVIRVAFTTGAGAPAVLNSRATVSGAQSDPSPDDNAHLQAFIFTVPELTKPVAVAPTEGQRLSTVTPTFQWSPVTGAVRYELRLGRTLPPSASLYNGSAPTFTPGQPLLTTVYFWQVRAVDANGRASEWSDARSFVIVSTAGARPMTHAYFNSTPHLRWGRISWATGYEIQVATAPGFGAQILLGRTLPGSTLDLVLEGDNRGRPFGAGVYYWRVRALRDGRPPGAWSATESFIVAAP